MATPTDCRLGAAILATAEQPMSSRASGCHSDEGGGGGASGDCVGTARGYLVVPGGYLGVPKGYLGSRGGIWGSGGVFEPSAPPFPPPRKGSPMAAPRCPLPPLPRGRSQDPGPPLTPQRLQRDPAAALRGGLGRLQLRAEEAARVSALYRRLAAHLQAEVGAQRGRLQALEAELREQRRRLRNLRGGQPLPPCESPEPEEAPPEAPPPAPPPPRPRPRNLPGSSGAEVRPHVTTVMSRDPGP
ncbi:uncharacterized protein ACIB01_019137 [Guaruba guarouba]